jgi:hypothetical protein
LVRFIEHALDKTLNHFCMVLVRQSSLSFKRTPPSVVLNDT